MANKTFKPGYDELTACRRSSRSLYWAVGLFSVFVNLLMLTGPLYMMQVYDRVLGSGSEATLVALSLLVLFLYGMMGLLDYVRGRVLARIGARFQAALDKRVFDAAVRRSAVAQDPVAQTATADLEAIQRLMSSPVLGAGFDLPWTPLFLAGIALFHPWLGLLALGGGAVLVAVALLNQIFSRAPLQQAAVSGHRANLSSEEIRGEAEMIQSMGMRGAAFLRWQKLRNAALKDTLTANDTGGGLYHPDQNAPSVFAICHAWAWCLSGAQWRGLARGNDCRFGSNGPGLGPNRAGAWAMGHGATRHQGLAQPC